MMRSINYTIGKEKIFMLKKLSFLRAMFDFAFLFKQNKTNNGSIETEVNELAVNP